ncbi:hypothetical protein [Mycobacteroides abscessus]
MTDYHALVVFDSPTMTLATAWEVRYAMEHGRTEVAFRLTDRSVIFTLHGQYSEAQKALAWLCPSCDSGSETYCRHAQTGSAMSVQDRYGHNHPLTIKRVAVTPMPPKPKSQQNQTVVVVPESDDFGRMLDAMTKMASMSMQDFYPS